MKRREFLATLGGAAAAWPLAARAQQPSKLPMIGVIGGGTPSTHGQWIAGFVQRLRELGWIEDRTVAIEIRWAEGRNERYTEIAAEVVRRKVVVILTSGAAVPAASMPHRSSRSCSRRQMTHLAPALSRAWRVRGATSPACRCRTLILLANDLNFCVRLLSVFAVWRY